MKIMFGFVIGTASLAGLMYVLTHGRAGRHWRGGAHRWLLHRLLSELDATREQSRTIREVVEELARRGRQHHQELGRSRADVAAAVRSDLLDEVRLGELFARHDELLSSMRRDFVEALGRIHVVLDERQRKILADRIEKGFGWAHHHRRWNGPYRTHPCCSEGV